MKEKLDKNKVGLLLGAFIGLWHAVWSLFVALGMAQLLLDWIYSLHFLDNPFMVTSFNIGTALMLIAVAFICGYLSGWVFAFLWNALRERK